MDRGQFRRSLKSPASRRADRRWIAAIAPWVLVLAPPSAQAAPIEFHYGGVITSANAGASVVPGSRFDGTFTYDPQARPMAMLIENARTYTFGQSSGPAASMPADTSAMSLTIGGAAMFSKQGGLSVGIHEVDSNDPYNPNPVTNLTFNSYNPSTKVDLEVLLSNPRRGIFGSLDIPAAINLADFPTATVTVSWWDATRKAVDSYQGTIDTLTPMGNSVTTVPEPSAVASWLGLGAIAWAIRARTRRGQ